MQAEAALSQPSEKIRVARVRAAASKIKCFTHKWLQTQWRIRGCGPAGCWRNKGRLGHDDQQHYSDLPVEATATDNATGRESPPLSLVPALSLQCPHIGFFLREARPNYHVNPAQLGHFKGCTPSSHSHQVQGETQVTKSTSTAGKAHLGCSRSASPPPF